MRTTLCGWVLTIRSSTLMRDRVRQHICRVTAGGMLVLAIREQQVLRIMRRSNDMKRLPLVWEHVKQESRKR